MCCFSGRIEALSTTRIFARPSGGGRQVLVYGLGAAAQGDLAMILPLPVAPHVGEDGLRFIDLSGYATFFDDLERGFPRPQHRDLETEALAGDAPLRAQRLTVHQVGDFEASFVPRLADFERLDPRFRLPGAVWSELPAYADHGFAVFKLRFGAPTRAAEPAPGLWARLFGGAPAPRAPTLRDFHPMAFELPLRDPTQIFFPTLHIHDGQARATAHFDHVLYAQPRVADPQHLRAFGEESIAPVSAFMNLDRAAGVLDAALPCYKAAVHGLQTNRDILVP